MKIVTFILAMTLSSGIIAVPSHAQNGDTRTKVFGVQTATLDNGMDIVVIPNHRAPVVTHMVWYKVGAADEKDSESGLAHYVEHLMFKGTENIPTGEFSKIINRIGGNHNAFTGHDITAYFQSVAKEHLEQVMRLEADRMVNLTFPPEELASEKLVVIEERRQMTENDPRGFFYEQMNTLLFPNHPYGTPVIGWIHEVQALEREAVIEFYNTWYAPNNAVLVISGDVTMDEVLPMARDIYGAIEARDVPERVFTSVPQLPSNPTLSFEHETLREPSIRRVYLVPSTVQNAKEAYALEVFANLMNDNATSRFYKSLVVDQRLASNTDFGYRSSNLLDGRLIIGATPSEGVPLKMVEMAIENELKKVINDGVSEDELNNAKTRLREAAIFARDSVSGPAMTVGYRLLTGSTIEQIEYWPYFIDEVTAEDIQNVARKYLSSESPDKKFHVTGYLVPQKETPLDDTSNNDKLQSEEASP